MGYVVAFKAPSGKRFYVSDAWGERASKKKSEAHFFNSAVGAREVANSLVRYEAFVIHVRKDFYLKRQG